MGHYDYTPTLIRKQFSSDYSFQTANYDHFQLIYVLEGVLHLKVQKKETAIRAGWVALLRKGSCFTLFSTTGYRGLAIQVFGDVPVEMESETTALGGDVQTRTMAELLDYYLLTPDEESLQIIDFLGRAFIAQAVSTYLHSLKKRQGNHRDFIKSRGYE